MSGYLRVIPRDLFNEASLLKCLGRLALLAERMPGVVVDHDGGPFEVEQDDNSGSIWVLGVEVRVAVGTLSLWRPLNSRRPWPLMAAVEGDPDCDPVPVFCDDGELSPEFLSLAGLENDDE